MKNKKIYNIKDCSPRKKDNNVSCLDEDLILKIAKILKKNNYDIVITEDIKKMHKDISEILENITSCDSEKCWLGINLLIDNLNKNDIDRFKNSFKPMKPIEWDKNPNAWLSNRNIDDVLKQYGNKYDDYYYHGALPVDFDVEKPNGKCLVDKLCEFDINLLNSKNKHRICMVFNTDPHNKSGSHWISLYIDSNGNNLKVKENGKLEKYPCIYFFDSAGDPPPKEIKDFIDDTKGKSKIKLTYVENDVQHQEKNTECGVYSLHFLDYMINGGDFYKYVSNRKCDKFMEKFRSIFFI